jgi:hypothetical protein
MNQRKVLVGVGAAVVVLAVAAYAGAEWLRYRVERHIEATFAALATPAGPATYGRARFDPWTRTVRISDIARPADRNVAPPVRIGELVLAGVPLFPGERITARRVELTKTAIDVAAAKTIRIDGVVIDDLEVSRAIDWQRLRALAEAGSGPPNAASRPNDVVPAVVETLEGLRFDRLEMRDLVIREGTSGFDVASVRLDGVADGRLAELTVRGANSVALPRRMSFGRVALEKLDLAGLLRKSERLNAANRPPTPGEVGDLLNVVEGLEMDEVVIPDQRGAPDAVFHFLSVRLAWGQFVGALPTTAHYALKMEMPTGGEYGEAFQALRDAGRKSLTVGFDLSSTWSEQTRTFALSRSTFELDTLFSVTLGLSIANVSPDLLLNDPVKTPPAAAALEAGPIELSLHDSGGIDFLLAAAAKKRATSVSVARAQMVDEMTRSARAQPPENAEFQRVLDQFARFVAGDGPTLKVSLTPKGRVNLKQTLELAKTNPIGALLRFSIEASVGAQ